MAQEVAVYWLIAQALGVAGLPLARVLFGALPDRGYAFAKSLGLLLAGYLAWLAAMLGLASFGAPLVVACAALVLAGGLLALRRPAVSDAALGFSAARLPYPASAAAWPLAWLRGSWRMVLGYEALFALALVFLAMLRGHEYGFVGPNPWGTERPMDYALFNAIRQSGSFPPHDPWLAGYGINYYYFGYLLMAAVASVGGQSPAVSYNLSLALIFALAALGAAGLVYNLIGLTWRADRQDEPRRAAGARLWPREAGRAAAMALAVVLVLLSANQGGALQVITGSDMAVALDAPDLARAVASGLGPREPVPLAQPFRGDYFEGIAAVTPGDQVAGFNWWNSSRAVWDTYPDGSKRYAITEFPFFSFWLGDMHPHVMALPFGLLAAALALATLARPALPDFGSRRGLLELALVGAVLGSLYVINSWDLPTYLLLFFAALAARYARAGGPFPWRAYALQAAPAAAAVFVLFLPFHLTFRSLVGGKEPLIDLPLLATVTRTIGFVTASRTALHQFLIIFGLFLVPIVAFALAQRRAADHAPPAARRLSLGWPLLTLAALVAGTLAGFPLLALLPLGLGAARLAFARAARPAEAFVLGAFALGCAICLGAELIYIRDVFESRLNTIFKFYYQVWLLWAVAAAYAVWFLVADAARRLAQGARWWRQPAALCAAPFALLLAGSLVYPWLTAGKAFDEGRWAGLAGVTPRESTPEGAAAIAWLRANAPGDSVVLEAVGPAYDVGSLGFGGVSAATGLATVIGWEGHQNQWRGGQPQILAEVPGRAADVALIYSTTDLAQARELLAKYGVDYIFVGRAEHQTYPAEGIAKLGQLGIAVFEQGDVAIYRVSP